MIGIIFTVLTVFAIIVLTYKRIIKLQQHDANNKAKVKILAFLLSRSEETTEKSKEATIRKSGKFKQKLIDDPPLLYE